MIETTRGVCKHCGQFIELELEHNPQKTANDKASMLCDCAEAKKAQQIFQDELARIVKARRYSSKLEGRNQ